MRLLLIALAVASLAGCGSDYDPEMCDFYQSLGVGWTQHQGYVPADVQADTAKYCER
jgi:hypothetical protein